MVGAGAAGLNAALEARKLGLKVAVIEKGTSGQHDSGAARGQMDLYRTG